MSYDEWKKKYVDKVDESGYNNNRLNFKNNKLLIYQFNKHKQEFENCSIV